MEQPRIYVPPPAPESMIIATPVPPAVPGEMPAGDAPHDLAAATSAAHAAAAIVAGEAELRRAGGALGAAREPGSEGRPPIEPPVEMHTTDEPEAEFGSGILSPRERDGIIEGTFSGEAPPMAASTRRMYQRRRRLAVVVFLTLAVVVLVVGQLMSKDDDKSSGMGNPPAASALPPDAGIGAPAAAEVAKNDTTDAPGAAAGQESTDTADSAPAKAAATGVGAGFRLVSGYGPVLGTTGTLRRFKVAVEKGTDQGNGGDFAEEVNRILGDPRSWIASGQFRLQRVPDSAGSEFTIYLASAETSEKMCAEGGLKTDGFTSCRLPGQVIMNMDRWEKAVPDYDAPLETYRAYSINHEVGHQLGHGHEACPGKGEPAPVMMQQTYGLRGCVANSWPYIDGKRYAGAPIS